MAMQTTVIGQSIPRLESNDKATGRAEYIHTMRLPGMLHAKVFRSDIPQRDAFDDRPIFGRCVAVTGGHEHMVVDGERLSPGLDGGVIKRGFSDSGPDGDRR